MVRGRGRVREWLALLEKGQPDEWTTFEMRYRLGYSLVRQKKVRRGRAADRLGLRGDEGPDSPRTQVSPDRARRGSVQALRGLGQARQGRRVASQGGEAIIQTQEATLRPTSFRHVLPDGMEALGSGIASSSRGVETPISFRVG